MGNNAYAVAETEIGAGIESVYGTPVVPTYWFPARQPKYKPDLTMNPDNTLQGSMNEDYDLVPGLRYDSEEWTAFPYMDSFGLLVCALLGSTDTKTSAPTSTTLAAAASAGATTVSATATIAVGSWIVIGSGETLETHKTTAVSGAGPYTVTLNYPLLFAQASGNAVTGLTQHEFSLLNNAQSTGNQPPSLTINDFDGEEWRAIPACVLDTLTIKGNQTGIAEYTVKFAGNSSITPSSPSPSFTGLAAVPSWTLQAGIGGTLINYIEDWEWTLKRGVRNIPGSSGTQNFFRHFQGTYKPMLKFTVVEQSGAPEEAAYLNETAESLDFTIYDVTNGYGLNIHSTKAKYKSWELGRSTASEEVKAVVQAQPLPNSTDVASGGGTSPMTITLANAITTAYH